MDDDDIAIATRLMLCCFFQNGSGRLAPVISSRGSVLESAMAGSVIVGQSCLFLKVP